MDNLKYKKSVLIEILKKNRDEHKGIFEEAFENYRKQVIKRLEEILDVAKSGKKRFVTHVELTQPIDQTTAYDRAIRQLEMTTQDEVELTDREFQNYIEDEWAWTNNFMTTNLSYSAQARAKYNQDE